MANSGCSVFDRVQKEVARLRRCLYQHPEATDWILGELLALQQGGGNALPDAALSC